MHIQEAIFLTSSTSYKQCPIDTKPELCFIGRSNVGKSSLINILVNKKQLAKTSMTPGKTQLINHYLINQAYYFVDLPGYGWARTSQKNRQNWFTMINQYIRYRDNLLCLFVLIDIRLPPQAIDLDFIDWLGQHKVPFAVLLTKADKISKLQSDKQLTTFQQALAVRQREPLTYIITSSNAKKQMGKEMILEFIQQLFT